MYTVHKSVIRIKGRLIVQIDNDLILKWEPKINKMVSNIYIHGFDRDDLAQELRLIVVKAAKLYKPNRNAIFHTYLHTSMVNTIRTLISKTGKIPIGRSMDFNIWDDGANYAPYGTFLVDKEILKKNQENNSTMLEVELEELINSNDLSYAEKSFIDVKIEGLTMDEISEDLGESSYKIRDNLKIKFSNIKNDLQV